MVRRFTDDAMFALKRSKPQDREDKQSIINECTLSSYLKCDQLLRSRDVYDFRKTIFVILDLMDGDLTTIIRGNIGTLSEEFCKWSLYQVAQGLLAMHNKNVLHRDIKSDNILYKPDGTIKICDMGFSVFLSEQ